MNNSFPNWLTETMIKGAKGFNLDAYVMALEGWRRGLTLTWYLDASQVTELKLIGFNPLGKSFSLFSNIESKTHHFYRSRGDKVANEAVDIVHNKSTAKTYFQKAEVPTPNGVMFTKAISNEEILVKIQELSYPLVVKPVLGSLGKGVVTNIQNDSELLNAVDYIRNEFEYEDIIVERYVPGEEYRVYVVDDKVVAATKRDPANVIGDGVSSIKQLIEMKNEIRKNNPYLANKPIQIDESLLTYLKNNQLSLDSIPQKNKKVRLKGQSNISAGGDPIDATDELSERVKQVALQAVKSIPGLAHAGVDVIAGESDVVILEVNSTADISMHLFPMIGNPRNVPEHVMDYYFPETIGMSKQLTKMYFDYREISKILRNQLAQEITLNDAPIGKLYTARYIVSGNVQKVNYRAWIRRRALREGLHGYTRNLKNGNVVVIVAGDDLGKIEKFRETCKKGPAKAKVEKVKELEWDLPVKVGFEIRETT